MRRNAIVENLKSALKELSVENGGFVKNFYEWVINPQEQTQYPAIVIRDTTDSIDSSEVSQSSKHNLKIEIDLLVSNQSATPSFLREKIQAILDVLKTADEETLLGDYVSLDGVEIELVHDEFLVGLGKIELSMTYYTEKWRI